MEYDQVETINGKSNIGTYEVFFGDKKMFDAPANFNKTYDMM
jgi:hypothetical protein